MAAVAPRITSVFQKQDENGGSMPTPFQEDFPGIQSTLPFTSHWPKVCPDCQEKGNTVF